MIALALIIYIVSGYEFILQFTHYKQRQILLDDLPNDIQNLLIIQHDNLQLQMVSDFILVYSNHDLSISPIPQLKGVYPQKKINRKPLASHSHGKGHKLNDVIPLDFL